MLSGLVRPAPPARRDAALSPRNGHALGAAPQEPVRLVGRPNRRRSARGCPGRRDRAWCSISPARNISPPSPTSWRSSVSSMSISASPARTARVSSASTRKGARHDGRWLCRASHRRCRSDEGFRQRRLSFRCRSEHPRQLALRPVTSGSAVVFGASGGIGGALYEALEEEGAFDKVHAFSRSTTGTDLTDEGEHRRRSSNRREGARPEPSSSSRPGFSMRTIVAPKRPCRSSIRHGSRGCSR